MRKVTITNNYDVYKFGELSAEAKERVRDWYLEGQDVNVAEDMAKDFIFNIFGHSELDVQFDVSCCQGSGVNIYGKIKPDNVLHAAEYYEIEFPMTEKEKRRLAFYSECSEFEKIKYNRSGAYSTVDDLKEYSRMNEYTEDLCNVDMKLIERYIDLLIEVVEKANREIYDVLYDFFYEISDEDLEEICDANGWEFLENGSLFTE